MSVFGLSRVVGNLQYSREGCYCNLSCPGRDELQTVASGVSQFCQVTIPLRKILIYWATAVAKSHTMRATVI